MMTENNALITRLAARRAWIGASDVAAILGVSPYANAADVYWQKVALLDSIETPATERGRYLEPAILSWFEEQVGQPIARDVKVVCESQPLIVAQLDGQLPDGTPVEAKTAASDRDLEGNVIWGAEYTDEIPDGYVVQAQTQMLAAVAGVCHVPALVGGFRKLELRRYLVERNDDLIDAIQAECQRFWDQHVTPRTPPDGIVPSIETIKRIRRIPALAVDLPASAIELADAYDRLGKEAKVIADQREDAQAQLLALLGEAEAGALPDGRVLTCAEQNGARRCDLDLLRAQAPDLYASLVTQPRHRTMRIKSLKTTAKKTA